MERADYLILEEGYRLLRKELEVWNGRALEHGALSQPYEKEVADISWMIKWGKEELDKNSRIVLFYGISVGSVRYVKAALMFLIGKREQERVQKVKEGWPSAALGALSESIERVRTIASGIT